MRRVYRSSEREAAAQPPPRKRTRRPTARVVEDVLSGATENRKAAHTRRPPAGRLGRRKVGKHGYVDTPICGAKKKNGEACRMFAGQGTNHTGMGACWLHGGTMRASTKKAERVKVEKDLARVGNHAAIMSDPMEGDVQPLEVLLEFLRVSIARTRWLDKKLINLEEHALFDIQGQVLAKLDGDERDRGARAAKYCIEAGVPGLRVRLLEGQAEMVAKMIQRALVRVSASAALAEQLGAALRVEDILLQAEEAGEEPDAAVLAEAEQALADVLAKHAPEPVADAQVVPESPAIVDEPQAESPQGTPLVVPEDWATG